MKPSVLIPFLVIALTAAFLLIRETTREVVAPDSPDGCTLCHLADKSPSPAHPIGVMGCAGCHMGNPFARDKSRAHAGMYRNPGSLEVAPRTCGQADCHPDIPGRVEKSLMATNGGILAVMQNLWPHGPGKPAVDVKALIRRSSPGGGAGGAVKGVDKGPAEADMALDHYRKMCGGCHLWRPRYPDRGETGRRGGGCTNCHIMELENPNKDLTRKEFNHPGLTTRIPSATCLKCHHRSARIGLSYFGRFESEGYGTPYAKGEPGPRRLSGGRFFLELPGDLHHRKAGMDCIDCHTEKGVMGDGKLYSHQEEQVDINCRVCHDPVFSHDDPDPALTLRLIRANGRRRYHPLASGDSFILSPRKSPLYHIEEGDDGQLILYRKKDGKPVSFKRPSTPEIHRAAYHGRLTCQACHSRWIPQCYGCHETRFDQGEQRGWLTGQKSPGRWVEGRSYLRFRRPVLGFWQEGRVGPFAPGCQVFIDVFDDRGRHRPEKTSRHLVMAGFDPHTTALQSPACEDCHLSPKALGLGEGELKITRDGLVFNPVYRSALSGFNIDFPLEAFVSDKGIPLQQASRACARPFNLEELKRITRVGLCLPCHDRYDDVIFNDFTKAFARFIAGKTPCGVDVP